MTTIETLTDKLTAGTITRDEFIEQMSRLTATTQKKRNNHNDAHSYVLEHLNVNKDPDPRVLVDIMALFIKSVEDQTGYVANPNGFADFGLTTIESVMGVLSTLRDRSSLFPTKKRSRVKLTYGTQVDLDVNTYIVQYLLNITDERVGLAEEDF